MIVPDLNLLVYAYDSLSPYNKEALKWWQECMSGTETVGLPTVVIFGFVRLSTSIRVFQQPMSHAEASANVRSWIAQPVTEVLDPGPNHVEQTLKLLAGIGTAGNLVADAQIAALAIDHAAVLYTADADFVRFPSLKWINPLTGTGTRKQQPTQKRKKRPR